MRSKPDYSDRIALCEHRETAICDTCFQKAMNDAYAIGREYGRLTPQKARLLTLEEIELAYGAMQAPSFDIKRAPFVDIDKAALLATARAAMRVVEAVENNPCFDPCCALKESLKPFQQTGDK